jgi:macrodomain Ter protein organizer (MatP/YcbG family)
MATATARNVDDRDYAVLGEMAQENGRSISEELRTLIAEATRRRKVKKVVADMRALAQRNPLRLPDGMTSLDLLREERDSW